MLTETESLTVIDRGTTGVPQLLARRKLLLSVLANVLKPDQDYGKIPGTGDKPTMFKSGAETVLMTFQLAAAQPLVEDLSTDDAIRYRINVPIQSRDGDVVGVGVGEASTNEEKYRWRRPVCDEEFDETPAHLRREKWARGQGGKGYKQKQVRQSPADLANTVLKMAHKRALIHGTLLATAASSVFNQDLEDFSDEVRGAVVEAEVVESKRGEIKRASESGAKKTTPAATVAPTSVLVTDARTVVDVRALTDRKGKPYYVVALGGDDHEYTTRDATAALEIEKFKSTDHLVRLSYKTNDYQGKTYYNVENFAIADADAPGPAATPAEPLTAADIPFDK